MVIEVQTSDTLATAESSKRKRTKTSTSRSAPRKSTRTKKQVEPKYDSPTEEEERTVVADLLLEQSFLEENHLSEVTSLLKVQGWDHLFQEQVSVDETLMKEFYENFSMVESHGLLIASFSIKGESHSVTSRELAMYLNVPHREYDAYVKGT